MTIPTYLPYYVFAGAAAALITILYGLNRALADTAWPVPERTRVFGLSAVVLLGWLAVSIVLATMGVYHVDESAIPTVQYGIVLLLLLHSTRKLPGLVAWPAGVGDIASGLLAPVVGYAYARAPRDTAGFVRAWNVFGILDLVVAVTTGFMTAPSLIQPIEVQPSSELMTVLPMVLIPIYLVPLSILLHLASLAKLHRATAPSDNRVASASA